MKLIPPLLLLCCVGCSEPKQGVTRLFRIDENICVEIGTHVHGRLRTLNKMGCAPADSLWTAWQMRVDDSTTVTVIIRKETIIDSLKAVKK